MCDIAKLSKLRREVEETISAFIRFSPIDKARALSEISDNLVEIEYEIAERSPDISDRLSGFGRFFAPKALIVCSHRQSGAPSVPRKPPDLILVIVVTRASAGRWFSAHGARHERQRDENTHTTHHPPHPLAIRLGWRDLR